MKRTLQFIGTMSLALSFLGITAVVQKVEAQKTEDVFCNIIKGTAPATILYETQDVIVINTRKKHAFVHCLIIPKNHVINIKDLDDMTVIAHMFEVAQYLNKQLEPASGSTSGDFTLTINNGKTSAQTVFHLHMHFQSPQQWKPEFAKKFRVQK